jgi:uncharacterized coiled-coil protein SlyX
MVVPTELLEYLAERERHVRGHLDRLHAQIAELSDQVTDAQRLLERLQLTRQTLLEVTGQDPEGAVPTARRRYPPPTRTSWPSWPESTADCAPEVCGALGLGDEPRNVENMRAKLKRLVGRDLLTEPEPGLFRASHRES